MAINAQLQEFFQGAVNELTQNDNPIFEYNNKVTLFNASTLIAITAVAFGAIALFSASLISLLMWGVVGSASIMTRKATDRSIGKIVNAATDIMSAVNNSISTNKWHNNLLVFGDIVIFKNWLPTTKPQH